MSFDPSFGRPKSVALATKFKGRPTFPRTVSPNPGTNSEGQVKYCRGTFS
jgi:hypothetical protein